MSFPIHAITDFSRYQEDQIGPVAVIIGNSLTLNAADFPGLTFTGAQIITKAGDYTSILGKPIYPSKTADLAASRILLETALHGNGIIVNTIANGNLVLLTKSGYPLTQPHVPAGPLPKALFKNIVSTTNPGEIDFTINTIPHAKGYMVCYLESAIAENDPHKWNWAWFTSASGLLKGLKGSVEYKIVCVGLGTDLSLSFSDPVKRTAQGS